MLRAAGAAAGALPGRGVAFFVFKCSAYHVHMREINHHTDQIDTAHARAFSRRWGTSYGERRAQSMVTLMTDGR